MQTQQTVKLGHVVVPCIKADHIPEEYFQKALNSLKFKQWCSNFNAKNIEVKSLKMLLVYMFGPNVGFINVEVEAYQEKDQKKIRIPGFTFIRGNAVAILVILNGKLVLTKQYRLPVGKFTLECPAGMMDEENNFSGVAAKELQEECGIQINQQDMIDLGRVMTSPGGVDEYINLFCVEKDIGQDKLNEILNKTHGESDESIQLELVDFTWDNILKTEDVKLISAAFAYFNRQQQKK